MNDPVDAGYSEGWTDGFGGFEYDEDSGDSYETYDAAVLYRESYSQGYEAGYEAWKKQRLK